MAIALRTAATTPRADRELIILRTAQLVGGEYEYAQHKPMAVSCGMTAAQLDACFDLSHHLRHTKTILERALR